MLSVLGPMLSISIEFILKIRGKILEKPIDKTLFEGKSLKNIFPLLRQSKKAFVDFLAASSINPNATFSKMGFFH
jgi:hypothetical protein